MQKELKNILNSLREIFTDNRLTKKQRVRLLKICASALLFIIGLFLNKIFVLKLIVFAISYVICAYDVIISAVKRALKGNVFEENMLMSVASVGAFILGEFAEGAAVMILFKLGEFFQSLALNRSRNLVKAMLELKANTSHKLVGNEIVDIDTQELKCDDVLIVRPGERVPIDAVILDGVLECDTSAITGEALPATFKPGDNILSGYINLSSVVKIKATTDDSESTVTRILKIVEEQQENKSESEKAVTKFARIYTPCVFVLTLFIAFVPSIITGNFVTWIYRALSLLVISCPCALVISVPLTYFGGIGGAGAKGILFKGSTIIDALCLADTLMLDKTGTLTVGKPSVVSVNPRENIPTQVLLSVANAAEGQSNHPLAKAIFEYTSNYVSPFEYENYREIPGSGCIAACDGHVYIGGSIEFLSALGIKSTDSDSTAAKRVFFAFDKIYAGYIELCDSIKENAASMLESCRQEGIRNIGMFSGDKQEIAQQIANKLKLDTFEAELKPEDKLKLLRSQRVAGAYVIFSGDGLNDAPALAEADVGIAMGDIGSDGALEAADVVIMDGNLDKIPSAIRIAKYTRRIVFQNIALTICVKLLVLLLTIFGAVSMTAAIFADVGVALIAIINAMRTLSAK